MTSAETGHMADLGGIKSLAQFFFQSLLGAGTLTGCAVAYIDLFTLILRFEEIIERSCSIGIGRPDQKFLGQPFQFCGIWCSGIDGQVAKAVKKIVF